LRLALGGGEAKFAVTLALALIENIVEAESAANPPPVPDQLLNTKPPLGVALSDTADPGVYPLEQFIGVNNETLPPAGGLALALRL